MPGTVCRCVTCQQQQHPTSKSLSGMYDPYLQVESILKPVRGIRDAQRRAGITPTNHSRHNVQAVKEQSRLNALQKLQQQDERIMAATSSFRSKAAGSGRQTSTAAGRGQPSRSSSLNSGGDLRCAQRCWTDSFPPSLSNCCQHVHAALDLLFVGIGQLVVLSQCCFSKST